MNERGITLVCFAVKEEQSPFARLTRERVGLVTLVTGIGMKNARKAIEQVFVPCAPGLVITAGFAGGLKPALASGTVVFDEDRAAGLVEKLKAAGAIPARFHCATRVAVTAAEKRALGESTGADAVEMESQSIRDYCRERGVPSATIRVVLDTAEEDLPLDFNAVSGADGNIDPLRLGVAVMKSPSLVRELLRLKRRTAECAARLAAVLEQAV